MNNEELKRALRLGVPVIYTDMYGKEHKYSCIQAIRLHKASSFADGRKLCVSVELLDRNSRSVYVVPAERIRPIKDKK